MSENDGKLHRLIARAKELYHGQPEVMVSVIRPFKINHDPKPVPLSLKIQGKVFHGFVLRTETDERKITQRGNSLQTTLPPWADCLKPTVKVYALQLENNLGILLLSSKGVQIVGGDHSESEKI